MLFNTVISIDTSTSMVPNISIRTLCLLLVLVSFMINNTLSIASSNASNRTIPPSTTIITEISMMNATIPSIIIDTGINRCRTAGTTITITVVVTTTTITMIAINTIMIIITSTRLLLLLVLALFINLSMGTNPIMNT